MTLSVVIPSYRPHAEHLVAAIRSAADQTIEGEPLIEVFLVMDGDDPVPAAAGELGVTVLRQRHQGVSAARNRGMGGATGDFVCFLDADDILLPGALAAGAAALRKSPAAPAVFGRHSLMDPDGTVSSSTRPVAIGDATYADLLEGNQIGMLASVLWRREVLLDLGGFDERLAAAEDYELYLRVARRAPVLAHGHVCAAYRIHEASRSADSVRMLDGVLDVLGAQFGNVIRTRGALRHWLRGVRNWISYYDREARRSAGQGLGVPVLLTVLRRVPPPAWPIIVLAWRRIVPNPGTRGLRGA